MFYSKASHCFKCAPFRKDMATCHCSRSGNAESQSGRELPQVVETEKSSFYITSASSSDHRSSKMSRSRPEASTELPAVKVLHPLASVLATSHTWPVNTWNVASEAGELNLKLLFNFQ